MALKIDKVFFVLLAFEILLFNRTFPRGKPVNANIVPMQLYCEYLKNPVGSDKLKPRLSWISKPASSQSRGLSQSAYQSMHQYDVYVSSGKPGEIFQTKFNFHGFRYVVIENLPSAPARQDAEATLIETDLAMSSLQ